MNPPVLRIHRTAAALLFAVVFGVGGVVAPVVHQFDHAVEWAQQQSSRSHDQADSPTLGEACATAGNLATDCFLLHRPPHARVIDDHGSVFVLAADVRRPAEAAAPLSADSGGYHSRGPPAA